VIKGKKEINLFKTYSKKQKTVEKLKNRSRKATNIFHILFRKQQHENKKKIKNEINLSQYYDCFKK